VETTGPRKDDRTRGNAEAVFAQTDECDISVWCNAVRGWSWPVVLQTGVLCDDGGKLEWACSKASSYCATTLIGKSKEASGKNHEVDRNVLDVGAVTLVDDGNRHKRVAWFPRRLIIEATLN
jgi:hypothetical protein